MYKSIYPALVVKDGWTEGKKEGGKGERQAGRKEGGRLVVTNDKVQPIHNGIWAVVRVEYVCVC